MNSAKYMGFSAWRLPTTPDQDPTCSTQDATNKISPGYSCTGSEMGHLFYVELGGAVAHTIESTPNSNYSLFTNLLSSSHFGDYWSSTPYPPDPSSHWAFQFYNGNTLASGPTSPLFVLPALDGDVAARPAA